MCTSNEAIEKAGEYVSSTITADTTAINAWSDEAEGMACAILGYDALTNWSSMDAVYRKVLTKYCSAYVAQMMVAWSMINYPKSEMGQLLADKLQLELDESERMMKDDNFKTRLGAEVS